MGFLDELKKLTRPYDDEDEEYTDEAEAVEQPEERPRSNPFSSFGGDSAGASASAPSSAASSASQPRSYRPRESKVVNLSGGGQTQVILVKPERFETAAEIADHLRAKRAVLVNLENTPKEVTRRLVDFLSGVTYAIDGSIKKVASNTYIITPPNVYLVGDGIDDFQSGSATY